jgi:hypothetical protein
MGAFHHPLFRRDAPYMCREMSCEHAAAYLGSTTITPTTTTTTTTTANTLVAAPQQQQQDDQEVKVSAAPQSAFARAGGSTTAHQQNEQRAAAQSTVGNFAPNFMIRPQQTTQHVTQNRSTTYEAGSAGQQRGFTISSTTSRLEQDDEEGAPLVERKKKRTHSNAAAVSKEEETNDGCSGAPSRISEDNDFTIMLAFTPPPSTRELHRQDDLSSSKVSKQIVASTSETTRPGKEEFSMGHKNLDVVNAAKIEKSKGSSPTDDPRQEGVFVSSSSSDGSQSVGEKEQDDFSSEAQEDDEEEEVSSQENDFAISHQHQENNKYLCEAVLGTLNSNMCGGSDLKVSPEYTTFLMCLQHNNSSSLGDVDSNQSSKKRRNLVLQEAEKADYKKDASSNEHGFGQTIQDVPLNHFSGIADEIRSGSPTSTGNTNVPFSPRRRNGGETRKVRFAAAVKILNEHAVQCAPLSGTASSDDDDNDQGHNKAECLTSGHLDQLVRNIQRNLKHQEQGLMDALEMNQACQDVLHLCSSYFSSNLHQLQDFQSKISCDKKSSP